MKCSKCGKSFSGTEKWCSVCGSLLSNEYSEERKYGYGEQTGIGSIFANTLKILTKPSEFILNEGRFVSSIDAWLFALVVSSIGVTFQFIWNHQFDVLTNVTDIFNESTSNSSNYMIFSPFITTLHLIVFALYAHFMLIITGSRRVEFRKTFNIVCFTEATSLLLVIPFGSTVIPFWAPVVLVSMLSAQHGISKLRTLLVILAPFIVLFSVVLVIIMSVLGGGFFLINYLKIFGF